MSTSKDKSDRDIARQVAQEVCAQLRDRFEQLEEAQRELREIALPLPPPHRVFH